MTNFPAGCSWPPAHATCLQLMTTPDYLQQVVISSQAAASRPRDAARACVRQPFSSSVVWASAGLGDVRFVAGLIALRIRLGHAQAPRAGCAAAPAAAYRAACSRWCTCCCSACTLCCFRAIYGLYGRSRTAAACMSNGMTMQATSDGRVCCFAGRCICQRGMRCRASWWG